MDCHLDKMFRHVSTPQDAVNLDPTMCRALCYSIFQTALNLNIITILESRKGGAVVFPIIQMEKLRHGRGKITCSAETQRA